MQYTFARQCFTKIQRTECSSKTKRGSQSEGERLARVLQTTGLASRRKAEEIIFDGRVKVNGSIITVPQTQVNRKNDIILVDDKKIASEEQQKFFYFVLNKAKGYVCSNERQKETDKLVVDIFNDEINEFKKRRPKVIVPKLFTVGRLDVNTTGLLFVTNDGVWAQKVTHPSNNVSKEYVIRISSRPTRKQFEMLLDGSFIDGKKVVPQYVGMLDDGNPNRIRMRMILGEGRNREVRQSFEIVGLKLESLKRIRVGGLKMPGDLVLGQFRELNEKQRKAVTDYGAQQSFLAQLQQGVLS